MTDPDNLQRFVDARKGVCARVLQELSDVPKTRHWMWFVVAVVMCGQMVGCYGHLNEPGQAPDDVADAGHRDVAEPDGSDDAGDVDAGDVRPADAGAPDAGPGDAGDGEPDANGPVIDDDVRPAASRYGVSIGWDALRWLSAVDLERTFDELAELGVGFLRTDLSWDAIQPESADAYDWVKFDEVVELANTHRIQMLPILHRSPDWARPPGTTRNQLPDLDAFRLFAQVAAERYQPKGVYHWEIWNEPNISMFLSPPDPVAYAGLLNAGYEGVKAGNRQAFVISAGLAAAPDTEEGRHLSAVDFARTMYQHQPKLDAFGFHPYGWPEPPTSPEGWQGWRMMESNRENLRALMVDNGDGAKKIWLTEYGAPTSAVSEGDQADFLESAYSLAADSEWAGPLFYYSFRDIGTDPDEPEHFYGLLRNDWSRKPGFERYRLMPRLSDLPE